LLDVATVHACEVRSWHPATEGWSLLSKAGVPIQTIQKVLGHSDISVTERHYQHLNTADQRVAMEKHLVFTGLPAPEAEALFTIPSHSAGLGRGEGRDPPVPRAMSRPSESGRQDLNLRPLGPEGPQADPHGVVPGHLASHPVDISGVDGDATSHSVAPFPPDATQVGALAVQAVSGPLLTIGEVATRHRVYRATIHRLAGTDVLQVVRISNSIRVPAEALERSRSWLQKPTSGDMP